VSTSLDYLEQAKAGGAVMPTDPLRKRGAKALPILLLQLLLLLLLLPFLLLLLPLLQLQDGASTSLGYLEQDKAGGAVMPTGVLCIMGGL
jgi:hypothetical protein